MYGDTVSLNFVQLSRAKRNEFQQQKRNTKEKNQRCRVVGRNVINFQRIERNNLISAYIAK